jgi:glycosyltransferase involved in cell wall biosynthesis
LHVCTVAPRNHLAQVRVLAESVREFHPMSRFTVLVIDGEPGERYDERAPYDVVFPTDVGLDVQELHRLALIHDACGLCTALTPILLAHLLGDPSRDRDAEVIVYLEPDSVVCADLDEVEAMARQHGVVLLPQVLRPPSPATPPTDTLTAHLPGLDDLGFVAVGPSARPFLLWWRARMESARDLDPARPVATVARWFELVPGPFDHVVWRDAGVGVAYWNLHERPLSQHSDGAVQADGTPLRWMRFSGYDADKPYLLSPLQSAAPESLLSREPTLAAVTADYRDRLLKAGVARWRTVPYRYGSIAGGPIPFEVRRLAAIGLSDLSVLDPPPPPFRPEGEAGFIRWLNQPWTRRGDSTVTLLLFHIWQGRPDLQTHFRDPNHLDTEALANWGATAGDYIEDFGHLHRPPVATPPPTQDPEPEPLPGLNIIGYLRGELGLGEAGRRMALAADTAGVPYQTAEYGFLGARQLDPFAAHATIADSEAPYRVNLLCVNADSTFHLVANLPPGLRRGRYQVGLWFWETDRLQPGTEGPLDLVDEVWVTNEHFAEVLRAHTDKPVLVTPLAVPAPLPTWLERRDLGLPSDRRIYLCCFDANSNVTRKNPMGALTAYRRAFGPDDGAHLVVKSINGQRQPEMLEQLWYAARDRPDIDIRDGFMSRSEMSALTQLSDVYVSLHRSEGFGLNLAAAMAAGKPVIATGYSGNLAFMNEDNSRLVPYAMTEVGPGQQPYPPDDHWAEPDLDVAAAHMARLLADTDGARALGARARLDIARTHGPEVAGGWIARRLDRILDGSPALAGT